MRRKLHPLAETSSRTSAGLACEGPRGREALDPAAVKAFFGGTITDYLKTPAGKELFGKLLADPETFKQYLGLLDQPGGTKRMARFLETPQGIDCFVALGKTDAGLRVLVEVGQTPEGRAVARRMLFNPIGGWRAIYKILKRLGEARRSGADENIVLPSFDLSRFTVSTEPVKELLCLMKDPQKASAIFHSFSESDVNAELCKRVLADKAVRKAFFDYLTSDPSGTVSSFKSLFKSKERRERIADIFMSEGGSKLLAELAEDRRGRTMLAALAITPEGRGIGIKVLLHHPLTVMMVGLNYFREPKKNDVGTAGQE